MRHDLVRADCNICMLAGPDQDGQYDLLEDDRCPYHGDEEAPVNLWRDRYEREQAEEEEQAWQFKMREQDRLAGHAPASEGLVSGDLGLVVPPAGLFYPTSGRMDSGSPRPGASPDTNPSPSPTEGRTDGTSSPVPSPQGKDAPRPPAPSPPGGWAPPSFPEWAE